MLADFQCDAATCLKSLDRATKAGKWSISKNTHLQEHLDVGKGIKMTEYRTCILERQTTSDAD